MTEFIGENNMFDISRSVCLLTLAFGCMKTHRRFHEVNPHIIRAAGLWPMPHGLLRLMNRERRVSATARITVFGVDPTLALTQS